MNRRLFLQAAAAGSAATVLPGQLSAEETLRRWTSGKQRVSLLELFTSEGCSSCPPADRWFSGLRDDDRLWTDFVPLAFHVDYWDNLGWKDPFSDPAHTLRQRAYATLWQSDTIYTPEFVINGREWRRSSSARPELPSQTKAPVLSVAQTASHTFAIEFNSDSDKPATLIFNLALLGMDEISEVTRGENAGRTLHHDFIVLAHRRAAANESSTTLRVTHPKAKAVAAWVSAPNNPTPLQSTGGWLRQMPATSR